MLQSALYEGQVRHRRLGQVNNAFRYSVFLLYLDLGELQDVFRDRWLWSVWKFNLAYLRRGDHLGDPAVPLDQAVRDLVQEKTGRCPTGPVRLLTLLRYFGHNFNPVSFYYCFDPQGEHVETIVAEINNTPWRERFCYVCDESKNEGTRDRKRFRFPKVFHVSPFMDMNLDYDWEFTEPGRTLNVHMINMERDEKVFEADMTLERREISGSSLARVLFTYPPMTLKVMGAIYWQALKLLLKGAPRFTHPAKMTSGKVDS